MALAAVTPAIPYRTDAPVSTSTFALALVTTIVVLAALVGVLMLVRRRGFSLFVKRDAASPAASALRLEATKRLSMSSTAHVINYEGKRFLVVECSRGTVGTVTPIDAEEVTP